jgi:hypothetical protein
MNRYRRCLMHVAVEKYAVSALHCDALPNKLFSVHLDSSVT